LSSNLEYELLRKNKGDRLMKAPSGAGGDKQWPTIEFRFGCYASPEVKDRRASITNAGVGVCSILYCMTEKKRC
jgi:hypothetical protein